MNARIFLALLFIGFGSYTAAHAQDEGTESFEALDISGAISADEDYLAGVLVELFEQNKVVDAFETKSNGKFKFTLFNDHIYTIQLTKEGYYTKRISVNTKLPEGYDNTMRFDFDINLDSKTDKSFDEYLVEYPSALISFDAKRGEYGFDKDYTRSYFEEIDAANR